MQLDLLQTNLDVLTPYGNYHRKTYKNLRTYVISSLSYTRKKVYIYKFLASVLRTTYTAFYNLTKLGSPISLVESNRVSL